MNQSLFQADAMIFPEGAGTGLCYGPEREAGPALRFRFENLPNLALWTKPNAPFVCVEPWHGLAARSKDGPDLTQRPFTKVLPAGEAARFTMEVTLFAGAGP